MPECRRLPRPEEMAADVRVDGKPQIRDQRSKRLDQFSWELQEMSSLKLLQFFNNRDLSWFIIY